jgi:protein-tyrosine phosphatase
MRDWLIRMAAAAALVWPALALAQTVPGREAAFISIPNLRDLGGVATNDGGMVRSRLIYRSDQLNPVHPDDVRKLSALGLKTVFDLRNAEERKNRPDQLPPGVADVWLNVQGDTDASGSVKIEQLMRSPNQANAQLGDGKAEQHLAQSYRDLVTSPSAAAAYGALFRALSKRDTLPALFHSTASKARAGWAAAALLALLGVPQEAIMQDFLRSNAAILPVYRRLIEAFVAGGGERAIAESVFGVRPSYLEAAFDEMRKRHGTIENYFADALGVDAARQAALRANFVAAK